MFATPQQAVDFVDRGQTATRHHGKQTLRASGFDESQESERSKLRGMNPVAIQIGNLGKGDGIIFGNATRALPIQPF